MLQVRPQETNAVRTRVANFVVTDDISRVEALEVNRVTAHCVKMVVIDGAALRSFHVQSVAAVSPTWLPCHCSGPFDAQVMGVISIHRFCKCEPGQPQPGSTLDIDERE